LTESITNVNVFYSFDTHSIHSLHFSQLFCQLTSPKVNLTTQLYTLLVLDKFPHNKNPWLSFRLRTRPQTTESLYLLAFLHSYLLTLDINNTVSTWLDTIGWMSSLFLRAREYIHSLFRDWAVYGNISVKL